MRRIMLVVTVALDMAAMMVAMAAPAMGNGREVTPGDCASEVEGNFHPAPATVGPGDPGVGYVCVRPGQPELGAPPPF